MYMYMYMYVCIYTYIYVYRLFCASCFGVGIPHRVLQLCEIPTAVSMCDVLSRVKSYATAWAYTFERFAYTSAGVKAGRICIYICLHVICNICSVTYFLDRQVDLTQSAITYFGSSLKAVYLGQNFPCCGVRGVST